MPDRRDGGSLTGRRPSPRPVLPEGAPGIGAPVLADDAAISAAIEKELQRITEEIELIKGKARKTRDLIALSTIRLSVAIRPAISAAASGAIGSA